MGADARGEIEFEQTDFELLIDFLHPMRPSERRRESMKNQKQTMVLDQGTGSRKETAIRLKSNLKAGLITVRKAGEKPLEY